MLIEEQTTETPESPATETPAGDTATPETPATETTEGGTPPVVAAPTPYTVNPSFKVKHLEKKFDDWITPFIKDAETEKKVRELYEKAHGLEFVKQDREGYQAENRQLKQTVQQEFLPMKTEVEKILHFRDKKDFGTVFELMNIPPQEVFKWAYEYATDPKRAAAPVDRSGLQAYEAQTQAQQYQQQAQQMATDYRMREMDFVLQRPEISQAQQQFDAARGPGAFKNEVIARGQYHWFTSNKDVPTEQAVQEVLSLIGWSQQAQQQQPAPGVQAQPQVATPRAPDAKPVIPAIQGKGTSPAKQVYSSMAQIEARRKEIQNQGQDA